MKRMAQNELNFETADRIESTFTTSVFAPPTELEPRIYCAPRRFDILTILCVSSVYGIAFAIGTTSKTPTYIWMTFLLVVTSIGLAQAILWKGKRPRLASILVGVVSFVIWMLFMMSASPMVSGNDLAATLFASTVAGSVFGYVLGAGIGGLFLVIEGLRDYLFLVHQKSFVAKSPTPYDG